MSRKILIIGGSGFVSGTLARIALEQGFETWVLTLGQRPAPAGAHTLVADRKDPDAFARAIQEAETDWDLVIDCIGYQPDDAIQDIAIFRQRTPHLAFVSTDFVFDPAHRRFPQAEETEHYASSGYGGNKRLCELELLNGDCGDMAWTVVRPCHIYGPGSLLGCLPNHGRDTELLDRLHRGEALDLVGGGHFLQQPILAADLCHLLLSLRGNTATYNQIFCTAGPEIAESRTYYEMIADILNVELQINETPVDVHLKENPNSAPFLCHRIYDLAKLKASGAHVPATPLKEGLRQHAESLITSNA
jgi:nucleoside-diphosphate-sugar epimerase